MIWKIPLINCDVSLGTEALMSTTDSFLFLLITSLARESSNPEYTTKRMQLMQGDEALDKGAEMPDVNSLVAR
jgi:hypothetical protein